MRLNILFFIGTILGLIGCNNETVPKLEGEIELSSQLYGVDSYFLYGYNFSKGDYIKYSFPFSGSVVPDLINLPFKNPDGTISAPGLNAPSGKNGFILLGEFPSLSAARTFFEDYKSVAGELKFVVDSDTVKDYQVWLQKTQLDYYAKMLVKDILYMNDGLGADYVVVKVDYVYQNDGTANFP